MENSKIDYEKTTEIYKNIKTKYFNHVKLSEIIEMIIKDEEYLKLSSDEKAAFNLMILADLRLDK